MLLSKRSLNQVNFCSQQYELEYNTYRIHGLLKFFKSLIQDNGINLMKKVFFISLTYKVKISEYFLRKLIRAVQEHMQCRHTCSAGTHAVQAHIQCRHTYSAGTHAVQVQKQHCSNPFIDHSTLNIFCN